MARQTGNDRRLPANTKGELLHFEMQQMVARSYGSMEFVGYRLPVRRDVLFLKHLPQKCHGQSHLGARASDVEENDR